MAGGAAAENAAERGGGELFHCNSTITVCHKPQNTNYTIFRDHCVCEPKYSARIHSTILNKLVRIYYYSFNDSFTWLFRHHYRNLFSIMTN